MKKIEDMTLEEVKEQLADYYVDEVGVVCLRGVEPPHNVVRDPRVLWHFDDLMGHARRTWPAEFRGEIQAIITK